MKIAITGKGGVGKTTVAALLARAWAGAGYKVLAIDADPVPSLAAALGFPNPDRIIPLSEMSKLVEERTGAKPGSFGQIFQLNPRVDDLPEKIAHEYQGVKLVVMGGITRGGGGCACPESTLIKALVRHIILERDERVIMDMEAGVEHLGRSTADAVNLMITVVEPALQSLQTARKIQDLAGQIGIRNVKAIANKVRLEADKLFIREHLAGIPVLGYLPYSDEIINSAQKGQLELAGPLISAEIKRISTALNS